MKTRIDFSMNQFQNNSNFRIQRDDGVKKSRTGEWKRTNNDRTPRNFQIENHENMKLVKLMKT